LESDLVLMSIHEESAGMKENSNLNDHINITILTVNARIATRTRTRIATNIVIGASCSVFARTTENAWQCF
jgi:hypothetical protein